MIRLGFTTLACAALCAILTMSSIGNANPVHRVRVQPGPADSVLLVVVAPNTVKFALGTNQDSKTLEQAVRTAAKLESALNAKGPLAVSFKDISQNFLDHVLDESVALDSESTVLDEKIRSLELDHYAVQILPVRGGRLRLMVVGRDEKNEEFMRHLGFSADDRNLARASLLAFKLEKQLNSKLPNTIKWQDLSQALLDYIVNIDSRGATDRRISDPKTDALVQKLNAQRLNRSKTIVFHGDDGIRMVTVGPRGAAIARSAKLPVLVSKEAAEIEAELNSKPRLNCLPLF